VLLEEAGMELRPGEGRVGDHVVEQRRVGARPHDLHRGQSGLEPAARLLAVRPEADELREQGIKVAMIRPISLFPYPYQVVQEAAQKAKDVLVVELSAGQMVEDVQMALEGSRPIHFHNRMGGMLVSPDEVIGKVKEIVEGAPVEVTNG